MTYRRNTKRYYLASLHAEGLSEEQAYARIRPLVLEQRKPWIFSANVKGSGRVAKPISEQLIELNHEIGRVWAIIAREGNPVPTGAMETEPTVEPIEEIAEVEPPKPIKKKTRIEEEKAWFVSEWRRVRAWIAEQTDRHSTTPIDSLDTMRPVQSARKMIEAGISAKTCLYAMALHWPELTRQNAGIEKVSFHDESELLDGTDSFGNQFHNLTGYVLKLMKARQNVMLIGPAGTGKSHIVRQAAELIKTAAHPDGLPYGETPMTPGATRGDLLGRMTASPDKEDRFILSQFVEMYSGGGVFNFEEIDAADPGMLIVVNNALASNLLFNSVNGESYARHEDFIAVSTANTFGLGADSKYVGREKLDLATIDRFRMARVLVDLDETLAENLMFG